MPIIVFQSSAYDFAEVYFDPLFIPPVIKVGIKRNAGVFKL